MTSITPQFLLAIAMGGALGSLARFGVHHYSAHWFGTQMPYGTLLVNVVGSFLIGALTAYWLSHQDPVNPWLRGLLIIGFLGSFTTFSAFSLDTLALFQQGDILRALLNMAANLLLSVLAVFLGYQAFIK